MTLRAIAWHRCCQGYFAGWPVLIENKLTDCTDATVAAGWLAGCYYNISRFISFRWIFFRR